MSTVFPRLDRLGRSQSPVVTIDGLGADWQGLIAAAVDLAPFPAARGIYYPGLRRIFGPGDIRAWSRTADLLERAAPYIAGAFDCDGFTLVEANYSLVTTRPQDLLPAQRHPHFDSIDPDFVALIAYLFEASEGHGTAFYRHEGTGIEIVDRANRDRLIAEAQAGAPGLDGYFDPGDPGYFTIGQVDAAFGRVGIWRGNVLHSGIVPKTHNLSPDPRRGRLTLNLFLQLTRS